MSRSVPAGITAALASTVRQPALACVLQDIFDRSYGQATGGATGRSAIVPNPAGGYVRAYVSQPGLGSDATVYSQLISDPTSAAQLSAWTMRTSHASMQAGVCLSWFGATLFLFYQRRSDLAVCYQTSADGATWSAEAVATTPGARVWALASAGQSDLFQAQDTSTGDDSRQTIILLTYASGSFTPVSVWTNPNGRISGMSAANQAGSFHLALGAQSRAAGGLALCTLSYAAGVWSPLTTIHHLDDPGTGLSAFYPSLILTGTTFRIACVVYDDGSATGSVAQACEMWVSADFIHWGLEQMVEGPFADGACIAPGPNAGWLLADAGVVALSTAAAGATNPDMDVSAAVIAVEIDEPASDVVTGRVILDNHDGSFSPSFPPESALRVGGRVQLSLGYGEDLALTHTLWIDAIDTAHGSGEAGDVDPAGLDRARTVLHVSNRARRLKHRVASERVLSGVTLLYAVSATAVGGGIPVAPASPGTPQFGQILDAFAISASHTWRQAFDRLASLFGFDWFVDESESLQLREPLAADSPSFAYGTREPQAIAHQITPVRTPSHIFVAGRTASTAVQFAQAIDFTAIGQTGEILHTRVADRLLNSSAQAQIRASLALRRAQRDAVTGWARLPLNPAHQPLDVITIEDESVFATLRIERIDWVIDMDAGVFEQRVELRAP